METQAKIAMVLSIFIVGIIVLRVFWKWYKDNGIIRDDDKDDNWNHFLFS